MYLKSRPLLPSHLEGQSVLSLADAPLGASVSHQERAGAWHAPVVLSVGLFDVVSSYHSAASEVIEYGENCGGSHHTNRVHSLL